MRSGEHAVPSHTARRVALRRAAHQLLDDPRVLDDPVALAILGPETAAALRQDPARFEGGPLLSRLRAFVVARARFAEDRLAQLRALGVDQYIVLGAGLDTFAYRNPAPELPLRIWEVDHPATQAWKRQLLDAAQIGVPRNLTFVPVNFERDTLASELSGAGFDAGKGAMVSWLGVTPYLTNDAVLETLAYLAMVTRPRGGVAFDYAPDPARMTEMQRLAYERLAERVAAAGEPFLSHFDPEELVLILRGLGFRVAQDVSAESLNARYFHGRSDGLAVGDLAHIMWAGATPLDDSRG